MRVLKNLAAAILIVFVGGAFLLGLVEGSYVLYKEFGPKYAQVENEIFHNTQAYNDSVVRDLENLQNEYVHSDKTQKLTLRAMVMHRFAGYPDDRLTPDLRAFYFQLRNERNAP
jgi:hypothetical protein